MALEIKLDCGGKEYRENIGKEGKKQIEKLELALRNQKAINVNDRGFNAKEKDLLISVPYPLSRGCNTVQTGLLSRHLIIHLSTSSGVSKQANERMNASERTSKACSTG